MNKKKYLTPIYSLLVIWMISILTSHHLAAQDWNFQMGINASQFKFKSPAGVDQTSFQPDAGLQLSILRNDHLFDSSKTKSGFVQKLNYQVGLVFNQFNSSGETQNVPFSYSSTYIGLKLGLGIKSRLGRGMSLSYSGIMQMNQLVLGTQKMGNQVFNLQGNKQFDRLIAHLGGELKLVKQINAQTALLTYFSKVWQFNTTQSDGSQFAIHPSSFGFGVQYSFIK